MKHLKSYNEGIFDWLKKKPTIEEICDKYINRQSNGMKQLSVDSYRINDDGLVDVFGIVDLIGRFKTPLKELPINFGTIKPGGGFSGSFYSSVNGLSSLKGSPKYVEDHFYCSGNRITSFEYAPEYIGGNFDCHLNKIESFEFFPKHVGGDFNCAANPIWEVWDLFKDISKVELFNDYDIIRPGRIIILDRLKDFLLKK